MALQRFEVITPLVNRPLPRGAQKVIVEELACMMHIDANNRLTTLGKRTIERYLSNYLKSGLEGLAPKVRPEHGALKAFPAEALDEAVKVRLARPELSADSIIEELRSTKVPGAQQMSVSTLNRHLRRLGKDRPFVKERCANATVYSAWRVPTHFGSAISGMAPIFVMNRQERIDGYALLLFIDDALWKAFHSASYGKCRTMESHETTILS